MAPQRISMQRQPFTKAMMDTQPTTRGPSLQRHRSHSWRPGGAMGSRALARNQGWQGVALWVGLTIASAAVGMLASTQADTFYAVLQKPAWAPPAWVFGPVWTGLYALMACAAVMVHWRLSSWPQGVAGLRLYALALLPNALWSWTFFHWHLGLASLAVIAVLWLLLLATLLAFWRVRRASAGLMVPVMLWVSFAAVLNLVLLRMNPGVL